VSPLGSFEPEHPERISRNHINILASTCIVVLPGAEGTKNEIDLSIQFGKQKKVRLFGPKDHFADHKKLVSSDDIREIDKFLLRFAPKKRSGKIARSSGPAQLSRSRRRRARK
jgi:hypothetical protein